MSRTLMDELRYSVRALRRSPGFTCVVVLTLALGIGATTAIFSVVDAVLLRPLPYPNSDRIVSFGWRSDSGTSPANITPLTFQYWKDHAQSFEGFAVTAGGSFNMVSGGGVERVRGASATADFFKVLGVSPALGRGFISEECVPGGPLVGIISHGMWQRAFGGARDVVGKSVSLNDRPYGVIGVMPATFEFEPAADLWYPLQLRIDPRDRGGNYTVMARLRGDMTLERAQSETDRLFAEVKAAYPQHLPRTATTITLIRFQDFLVAQMKPLLTVLTGAVGLVLLIACGNVANLLLARSANRQRELAIRVAVGAGGPDLVRQIVAESLLLSLMGGIAGAGLAAAGLKTLVALIPGDLPRLNGVAIDQRVMTFASLISVTIGFVVAIGGALRLMKADPAAALKAGAGSGIDVSRQRLSNALVVGQVALSVILFVGAGLLAATFVNLRGIRIGFETENLMTIQLPLSPGKLRDRAAVTRFDADVIQRIEAIPGVRSATTASSIPLERGPNFVFGIEGEPADRIHYVELRPVGPNYFRTLGISLRVGQDFMTPIDEPSSGVVVNETLARLFGSPADAIGRRIVIGRTTPAEDAPREIVGVVPDVADGRPGSRLFPTLYLSRSQFQGGSGMAAVLVRTIGGIPIAQELRRAIQSVDPQLPIAGIRTMKDVAATAIAQQRFNMTLVGAFAAAALILTVVGLYGLLSYHVTQRTREVGIRMALGARRADVMWQVVRRGLTLAAIGLALGVAGSLALTRFVKALLFGVNPTSPTVFAGVTGLLLMVAFVASAIPARRAMCVDPIETLRRE